MKNQRVLKKRPKKVIIKENTTVSCPECNSTEFDYDSSRGEISCRRCGLIIDENMIDNGPEWRAFNHEQKNSRTRVGAPLSQAIHDHGLCTDIDFKNNNIPQKNIATFYRLRKWNKKIRISGSRERNLASSLSQLDRKCSNLALPRSVRENASLIYRKALENKLIRGRTIEGVIAAVIYIACRLNRIPRTLAEISLESDASQKEIGRTYRFLARELKIKLTPTSPADYIPRFATKLEASNDLEIKAIRIVEKSRNEGLTNGKGPSGIAAAALYIASLLVNERKCQKDVAKVAGVTEVTLRNRYKELSENLNLAVI